MIDVGRPYWKVHSRSSCVTSSSHKPLKWSGFMGVLSVTWEHKVIEFTLKACLSVHGNDLLLTLLLISPLTLEKVLTLSWSSNSFPVRYRDWKKDLFLNICDWMETKSLQWGLDVLWSEILTRLFLSTAAGRDENASLSVQSPSSSSLQPGPS